MKNQTAKFTCSTDSTLTISAHRGKTDWVVSYRQKTPGERTRIGKDYVELSRETDAQQLFDKRVKEAQANGWSLAERATRGSGAFTAIPPAPGATAAAVSGGANAAPRAAAARR